MTRSTIRPFPILAVAGLALALTAASCSKKGSTAGTPTGPGGPTATVTGVVISGGGSALPLPGVSVSSTPSAAAPVTTNSFGLFTLTVPANTDVSVEPSIPGYASHPEPVNLEIAETRALALVLAPVGAHQSVVTASGGTVVDPLTKSAVQVPAGFVTGTSNADVSITGISPDQPQVIAMPGTFAARTLLGADSSLEPFALAEVNIGDGAGTSFPLAQPVTIELHLSDALAADARITGGQPVPILRYDSTTGVWNAFGTGAVVNSSVDGKKAVQFSVNSLSWFAAGFFNGSTVCASGVVTSGGSPAAGTTVHAYPGDVDVTGNDGLYQVRIPPNRTARLVAVRPGTGTVSLASATVVGGDLGTGCVESNLTLSGGTSPTSYTVDAQLVRGRDDIGVLRDFASVRILANDASSTPLSGASVTLHNGVDTWTVTPAGSGLYTLTAGLSGAFNLDAGTSYTLDIDLEPDGVVDGSATLVMPAQPQITAPTEGATVGASFEATWFDPLAGAPGYSVRYVGSIENELFGTFPAIFALDTPAASTIIGTGTGQPEYSMPNDSLNSGPHRFRLWATNGPIRYPVGGTVQFDTANLNSSRIVGWYSAVAKADSVGFNSLGSGGPRPAALRRIEDAGGLAARPAAEGPAYLRRR